jgi:hypothetical protein
MSEPLQQCSNCDCEMVDLEEGEHECKCGQEISAKWCKEHIGLCSQCEWLLDK